MEKNQKLPVLGELEATDPKQIVTWAKKTLTCGKAFPNPNLDSRLLVGQPEPVVGTFVLQAVHFKNETGHYPCALAARQRMARS